MTYKQSDAFPGRVIPPGKIRKGKPRRKPEPINQGNLLNPDKITYGNLPQDQRKLFDE